MKVYKTQDIRNVAFWDTAAAERQHLLKQWRM